MISDEKSESEPEATEALPEGNTDANEGDGEVIELKVDIMSSPIFILVTMMAYIALSGGKNIPVEQKAEFISTLRKHVTKDDISEEEMRVMMHDSFEQTDRVEYRTYLDKITPRLSYGQRLSVIANLYDMMMVDGELLEGEESKIDLARRVFELDPVTTKQIRRVMLLKNDTAIFLNPGHPGNDPDFRF